MSKEEIAKKIKSYYQWKWRIARGLIISLILTVVPVIMGSILALFPTVDYIPYNNLRLSVVLSVVGLISYFVLWGFVIAAAFYPVGKYSLENTIQKSDIKSLLEFITNLNCDYNEQYDSLMVISRTAKGMISQIIGWDVKGYEGCLNQAWNLLNRYFQNRVIANIDFGHFKKYAEELLLQLNSEQINPNRLESILEEKYEVTSKIETHSIAKKKKLPAEFWIQLIATISLVFIILIKLLNHILPSALVSQNIFIFIVQDIGSDVISIIFAVFAIKSYIFSNSN